MAEIIWGFFNYIRANDPVIPFNFVREKECENSYNLAIQQRIIRSVTAYLCTTAHIRATANKAVFNVPTCVARITTASIRTFRFFITIIGVDSSRCMSYYCTSQNKIFEDFKSKSYLKRS